MQEPNSLSYSITLRKAGGGTLILGVSGINNKEILALISLMHEAIPVYKEKFGGKNITIEERKILNRTISCAADYLQSQLSTSSTDSTGSTGSTEGEVMSKTFPAEV